MPPDRRMYVCELPLSDVDTRQQLQASATSERVVMTLSPRPGGKRDRTLPVAEDLAAALGKSREGGGSHRNANEAVRDLQAWLLAGKVQQLVVLDAHQAGTGPWYELIELAAVAGCELWLTVEREHLRRVHDDVIRHWQMGWRDAADLRLDAAPAVAATARPWPQVPEDDWPFFLSSCEQLLEAPDVTVVRDEYRTTFDETLDWLLAHQPDDETMASFLLALLQGVAFTATAMTRMRAAQAAAFAEGWLVALDMDKLLAARDTTAQLTPEVVAVLGRYVKASPPTVGLLTLLTGGSLQALTEMTMDADVDVDGAWVNVGGQRYDVPAAARTLVRAQRIQRQLEGAAGEHPFFGQPTSENPAEAASVKTLHTHRGMVTNRGGVRIQRGWSERQTHSSESSLRRLGVSVRPLRGDVVA